MTSVISKNISPPAVPENRPKNRVSLPNFGLALAYAYVLLIILFGLVPWLFTPYDPLTGESSQALIAPNAEHWFGTDYLGRDLLARILYGTRFTVLTALLAVAVGLVAGVIIGLASALLGKGVDAVLMRAMDALLSIPGLLLSLCFLAAMGKGLVPIAVAVGIGSIASVARLTRVEALRVISKPFVEASHLVGLGPARNAWRHVLPHIVRPVSGVILLDVGASVLAIAALGFLGYGVTPPQPEWGLLIAEGRNYIATAWWLTTFPGIVVILLVLSLAQIHSAYAERSLSRGVL